MFRYYPLGFIFFCDKVSSLILSSWAFCHFGLGRHDQDRDQSGKMTKSSVKWKLILDTNWQHFQRHLVLEVLILLVEVLILVLYEIQPH